MQWYYADQGQKKGPVEESTLDELVLAGVVPMYCPSMYAFAPGG